MTFKKSMISIAAASVIAAGLTGCGSSSTTATSTDTDTATTGLVTSIKVVDGEVINAEATATYLKEDNSTGEVAIADRSNWLATSIDQNGTSTYDISELNATVLDNLISVKFETKAAHESNGTIYAPTFFDTNGNGIQDATETLAGDLELNTPAGFSVATPITTLIASMVQSADINESNRTALVAQALEDISESLGLDATDIKSVDPLTATDKPQYAAINALLGAVTRVGNDTAVQALATALAAKAAPANTSAAFANLAAAATTAGETDSAAMFTAFEVALEADSSMLDGALTMDLDALRTDSLADGSVQISYQTSTATDYNVTQVEAGSMQHSPELGNNHIEALVQNGAKISDLNIEMDILADGNITTKTIGLVLKVANEKASVEADANLTQLTVYLPVDMNATEGVITASLNPSALISYEGVTAAGTIKSGDANASALGLTCGNIVSNNRTSGENSDEYALEINATALLSGIDSNMSNVFDLDLASVASVQAALVDTDSITQKVSGDSTDGYATSYWGTTTVSSITGAITKTGKTILNLTGDKLADMRADVSGANVAPNPAYVVQNIDADTNRTRSADNDLNATHGDLLDLNITAANAVNSYEANTTVLFTLGAGLKDINLTEVMRVVELNGTANVTGAIEANSTTDAFTTLTATFTDEFGDSNSTITDIFVNAAPTITGTYTAPTVADDVNGTWFTTALTVANMSEMNNTITLDTNLSFLATDTNVTGARITTGNKLQVFFAGDANASDTNVTIYDPVNSDLNATYNNITYPSH